MKRLLAFLLLLAPFASAQVVVNPGGGGSATSSGSTISGCTSSILYADASSLLKCDPAAVVNGSVSTAGRSILTIQDTISGSSATSNFLNITGTFPASLSATTSGIYFNTTGSNSVQDQRGLYSYFTATGVAATGKMAGVYGEAAGTVINNSSAGVHGKNTGAVNSVSYPTYGVLGDNVNNTGSKTFVGVGGFGNSLNGASGNNIGGFFAGSAQVTTAALSAGVVGLSRDATISAGGYFGFTATSFSDPGGASVVTNGLFTGKAALIADNQSIAANIFEARDNGTAVFTIADSGIAKFDLAGTATAPAIGASSDCCDGSGSGWYHPGVNDWRYTSNGTDLIAYVGYVGLNGNLQMTNTALLQWQSGAWSGGTTDLIIGREAAAILQLGADVNGAAVNQTLKAHDGITGTNVKGASLTLAPGLGTGAAVSNPLTLNRVVTKATGTTAQTYSPAMVYCPTKILSNTSATAQTIATITTTSTTGGSVTMDYTTVANNGTLQDTDSGMVKVSWNNNAGTVAAAMTAVALQSDSDASGTLATTPTATVATNVVSIKFTPTWVTIVPTTVTGWATFTIHSSGDTVACQ